MSYSPQMISPDVGNLIAAGTTIAGGGTNFAAATFSIANIYERRIYVSYNNGAATQGLKVQAFPKIGTSVTVQCDDSRIIDFTLAPSSSDRLTYAGTLPPGVWTVKITNLDTSVTATIALTSEDITSISPS